VGGRGEVRQAAARWRWRLVRCGTVRLCTVADHATRALGQSLPGGRCDVGKAGDPERYDRSCPRRPHMAACYRTS
jgi:hypothetical protein